METAMFNVARASYAEFTALLKARLRNEQKEDQ
jgi:hypothetical protein